MEVRVGCGSRAAGVNSVCSTHEFAVTSWVGVSPQRIQFYIVRYSWRSSPGMLLVPIFHIVAGALPRPWYNNFVLHLEPFIIYILSGPLRPKRTIVSFLLVIMYLLTIVCHQAYNRQEFKYIPYFFFQLGICY